MASMQEADDEVTRGALLAISSLERAIFGGSIRRNIRNQRSRFYALQPKYGIAGSSQLIVAQLWLLPAIMFLIVAVALNLLSNGHQVMRQLSYVSFGLFVICALSMALRALAAARTSRRKPKSP
jgi:uncharacterized membrane protein YbhN (UPF0104 family)